MYEWLHTKSETGGRVAIFDATNTTIHRRLILAQRARKENVYLLFVESICDDEEVLNRNYDLKLQNDDYKGNKRIYLSTNLFSASRSLQVFMILFFEYICLCL